MKNLNKPYDGEISIPGTIALIVFAILGVLARQYRRKTDYEAGFSDGYDHMVQVRRRLMGEA